MKKIYIEKLAVNPGGLPARPIENHIFGGAQDDGHSLPVEYNIEGMVGKMEVGHSVYVLRNKRNGIECGGTFQTTALTEIGENFFKTKNSVYFYKFL